MVVICDTSKESFVAIFFFSWKEYVCMEIKKKVLFMSFIFPWNLLIHVRFYRSIKFFPCSIAYLHLYRYQMIFKVPLTTNLA